MRFIIYSIILIGCLTGCKKKEKPLEVSFSTDNLTSAYETYNNAITVTIELSEVADRDVYIKYTKGAATSATEGSDYNMLPVNEYFVIHKGEISKSFSFVLLQDNDYLESDEKIVFKITNAYSANIKSGGDSYTFTIKANSYNFNGNSANLILNGNSNSTISSNLTTTYNISQPNGYHYVFNVAFGSTYPFNQCHLTIFSKTILPVGKILPVTSLVNPPDTGVYIAFGFQSSISGTLKIVANDTINKSISLLLNGIFTGNNTISGTIDYSFYNFPH